MVPDSELMARVREHDANAFEMLLTRYRESIYGHVLVMLHDSSAAEDIVQEVFLRIWTHAEQWHGHGSFKSWLFRIATNLALMQFLNSMSPHWNISLFHYRNHGADYGRVLIGIQVPPRDHPAFQEFLDKIGYSYVEESDNPAYRLFLG